MLALLLAPSAAATAVPRQNSGGTGPIAGFVVSPPPSR
jgi:hypothetical protein